MNNIFDVLHFCDTTMQSMQNRVHELILKHGREIETTLKLFANEESKYLYTQEIAQTFMSAFVHPGVINHFLGLITQQEYEIQFNKMKNHKICELLQAPNKENSEDVKVYDLTGTFIFEQYNYKDIVCVENGDVVIDGGAFIGDTAIYFTQKGASKVFSFECDQENLECLKINIKNFGVDDKVEPCDFALSQNSGNKKLKPMAGNISGGSVVDDDNSADELTTIKTISIDDFCNEHDVKPNFIKMDIEGSELNALIGAQQTIKECKPKLAICIYHKLSDRWEIPLLLHQYMPEYKFYVDKTQPCGETVFFAI